MKNNFRRLYALLALALFTNTINAQIINIEFRNGSLDATKTIYTFDVWALRGVGYDPADVNKSNWQFMNIRADVQVPPGVRLFDPALFPGEPAGASIITTGFTSGGGAVVSIPGKEPDGSVEYGVNLTRTNQPEIPDVTGAHLATVSLFFNGPQLNSNTTTVRPFDGTTFTAFWTNLDSSVPRKVFQAPIGLALPVTLASFEVARESNQAMLKWTTSEETNSDHFDVQRSSDGKNWATFETVASSGDSKIIQTYTAVDIEPVSGVNLYRLHMLDKDGSSTYSRIRSIKFDFESELTLYPNPVSDDLFIKSADLNKISSVEIYNVAGRQVYKSNKIFDSAVNVRGLAAGVYTINIVENNVVTKTKILISR